MTWQEFAQQDPELAALGQERLDRNGLVMVAKLRKNGWPRISPVEPLFHNGQLYLGMMWRSRKALDLLRDPRCSIHNAVSDRMASEGESRSTAALWTSRIPRSGKITCRRDFKRSATSRSDTNFTASPWTSKARRRTRSSAKSSRIRCGRPASLGLSPRVPPQPPPRLPTIPVKPGPGNWRR